MREAAAGQAGSGGTLSLRNITRRFGAHTAVNDVSLDVAPGELLALVGASGSGKTTTLRIAAGYEHPDSGSVLIGDKDITRLPPQKRAFGMVFQHYALFRHMTVAENIGYGLKVRGVARAERCARVDELLSIMGLQGLGERLPGGLSGGQRQRVALARSLAPRPRLLLLDEPFAAVDAKVREELRMWLRRMHDDVGVTSLFVTHDQDEAFSLA